jgi:hypothetical protein
MLLRRMMDAVERAASTPMATTTMPTHAQLPENTGELSAGGFVGHNPRRAADTGQSPTRGSPHGPVTAATKSDDAPREVRRP